MLWLICNADDNPDNLSVEEAAAEEQEVLVEAPTFEAAAAIMARVLGWDEEPTMPIALTKEQYDAGVEGQFYLIPVEPMR